MGEGVEQFVKLCVGDDQWRTKSIRIGVDRARDRTQFEHSVANFDVVL